MQNQNNNQNCYQNHAANQTSNQQQNTSHPIAGLMETTMSKIKDMVDVNTIIGTPITCPDGTVIIPISKISYGFASGGSDFPTKTSQKEMFGGGSGAGVTIAPIGFLTVYRGEVKMLNIEKYDGPTDRIVGMVPEVIDKVGSLFKKDKKKCAPETASEEDAF